MSTQGENMNDSTTSSIIKEALKSYGLGIHHAADLARHIARKLNDEGHLIEFEPEHKWSKDLAGVWVEDPYGKLAFLLTGQDEDVTVWNVDYLHLEYYKLKELTLRNDLAPVDFTPASEGLKFRVVETEEEYESLPFGSVVASEYHGSWEKKLDDTFGSSNPFLGDCDAERMAGEVRYVLREGWTV